MRSVFRFLFLLTNFLSTLVYARSVILVDMDHTVVRTNDRIVAITRHLGKEFNLPQLTNFDHAQIPILLKKDYAKLGLKDPALIKRLFGNKGEFYHHFYRDPSWFRFDGPIPGVADFLEEMAEFLDADIVYLTGRLDREDFVRATIEQLEKYNLPGFGTRSAFRNRVKVIHQPEGYQGTTAEFKAGEAKKLRKVRLVVDDSVANVNKLREALPADAVIIHYSQYHLSPAKLKSGIMQIDHYGGEVQRREIRKKLSDCGTELGREK